MLLHRAHCYFRTRLPKDASDSAIWLRLFASLNLSLAMAKNIIETNPQAEVTFPISVRNYTASSENDLVSSLPSREVYRASFLTSLSIARQ